MPSHVIRTVDWNDKHSLQVQEKGLGMRLPSIEAWKVNWKLTFFL